MRRRGRLCCGSEHERLRLVNDNSRSRILQTMACRLKTAIWTAWAVRRRSPNDVMPHCLAFSPDSRMLAVGDDLGQCPDKHALRLWDMDTGRLSSVPLRFARVLSVVFSPDDEQRSNEDILAEFWSMCVYLSPIARAIRPSSSSERSQRQNGSGEESCQNSGPTLPTNACTAGHPGRGTAVCNLF
jgi:WD40 repeat protein